MTLRVQCRKCAAVAQVKVTCATMDDADLVFYGERLLWQALQTHECKPLTEIKVTIGFTFLRGPEVEDA